MMSDSIDALARDFYTQSPALSPFTRTPIAYETARELGINSWTRAHRTALETTQEVTNGLVQGR